MQLPGGSSGLRPARQCTLAVGREITAVMERSGSVVPVHLALNWAFAGGLRPQLVEYPVLESQR